ncbi:dihydroneopterin aldolase [Desulfurobacterium atlanticum]|uniref:Dihydroneopterin aldolase n=1 Tax=Desulfurobacterium atlanticum TaxID=240169 RepID=A0A239A5D8_9BACT|nr:dihydroneopterin aldolase [Desulfurobacterium atlanticum]SNR90511.1 dihydroneopterin aldolase [Desulfurobacterium atlanticum]
MKKVTVFIRKCKLHIRCGVYEEERKLGVEVEVDIKVLSEKFVDYQELYNLLVRTSNEEFIYLEDFTETVINNINRKWNCEKIEITVSKRSLPFQNSMEAAGINVVWEKNNE